MRERPAPVGPPERIILIVVDTLRRDHVSAYGGAVQTPNMDRLARRGQLFTNATASYHQTTMSMAALFTGRTPSLESPRRRSPLPWTGRTFCGMARFSQPEDRSCVPGSLSTLAEELRDAGFWTAGVVANRFLFRPYGYDQGFDVWKEIGPPDGNGDIHAATVARSAPHVNAAARAVLVDRPSDRFFLYVHYLDVHDYGRPLPVIDYADGVRAFDAQLGYLLDMLEDAGLMEDAAVLLVSDHGESLGEEHPVESGESHKGNPSFEPVLRIPLIVSPPLFDDPDRFIRSEDVGDLVRELAGIPTDRMRDLEPDELFVSENHYQTYRRGRWKSVWPRKQRGVYLFDLEADPDERSNVADEHPQLVRRHAARVRALASELSTELGSNSRLSDEDRERLRVLGYLEEEPD